MKRRVVFRGLVVCGVAAGLVLVAGWAGASNMGFKLNFGIVNAVNKLLQGSGVSLSAVVDDNVPQRTTLAVNLDLAYRQLPPANSNMGFKLNVMSLPAEGIEVVDPNGKSYALTWNGSNFGLVLLAP